MKTALTFLVPRLLELISPKCSNDNSQFAYGVAGVILFIASDNFINWVSSVRKNLISFFCLVTTNDSVSATE